MVTLRDEVACRIEAQLGSSSRLTWPKSGEMSTPPEVSQSVA